MKAGCIPIISKLDSGINEIVTHKKNGFMVNVKDVDGFAKAVIEINDNTIYSLKSEAANTANHMFNPYKNANKYLNAFLNTTAKEKLPKLPKPPGRLLDLKFLPNFLVRWIRNLNINQKL